MSALLAVSFVPTELDERRLDEVLGMWARWMDPRPGVELGYPDKACGCVGGGYSQTFEDMLDVADTRVVEAVDGAIESLDAAQQCAVMHVHLYAVFRFRDLHRTYMEARTALRLALPQRGVY